MIRFIRFSIAIRFIRISFFECDSLHSFFEGNSLHSFFKCDSLHWFFECDSLHSFLKCDSLHSFFECDSRHSFLKCDSFFECDSLIVIMRMRTKHVFSQFLLRMRPRHVALSINVRATLTLCHARSFLKSVSLSMAWFSTVEMITRRVHCTFVDFMMCTCTEPVTWSSNFVRPTCFVRMRITAFRHEKRSDSHSKNK